MTEPYASTSRAATPSLAAFGVDGTEYRHPTINRTFRRKFDHGEARRMYAQGMEFGQIASILGVSRRSIRRVCLIEVYERDRLHTDEWQRAGTCPRCGAPKSRATSGAVRQVERCKSCATLGPRRRFDHEEALRLYRLNWSYGQIARHFDATPRGVRSAIDRLKAKERAGHSEDTP